MRAATYARYSTDMQSESSIEDQVRLCRARAEREGWSIEISHDDQGISGSTPVARRPGGKALLADVLAGRFEVLVLEGLDRLTRDHVEQEQIVRRLEHRGIRIVGVSDGYDSHAGAKSMRKITRTMRGLMNEIFIDDLRAKTHRGLVGKFEHGFHTGGISYGYCSIAEERGHRLEIDEDQARWVRWIFERYAAGDSCQAIASALNAQRVPAARGRTWAVSALYGSPAKGSGILNNEVYIGRIIWNRSQWTKDPDTGRRQRLDRPREEWKVAERPDLAIVSVELWAQVRRRLDGPRLAGGARGKGARPRTLFGGLLRCGRCGGAVVATSQWSYGCAARKDRGATVCQGVAANRKVVDGRLLSVVREGMFSAEALAELQRLVTERVADGARDRARAEHGARARLAELEAQVGNLVQAVASFGPSEALRARLQAAEAELGALRRPAQVATEAAPTGVLAAYRRLMTDMRSALERDTPRARGLLQDLLGEIRLVPEGDEIYAELEAQADRLLVAAGGSSLGRVAGTRFVTRRRIRIR